jgi:hypothetical protein
MKDRARYLWHIGTKSGDLRDRQISFHSIFVLATTMTIQYTSTNYSTNSKGSIFTIGVPFLRYLQLAHGCGGGRLGMLGVFLLVSFILDSR